MPNFRLNVSATHKGAVFNSAATKAAAARAVIAINEAIAQEGVARVQARLHTVLKNPTPYYQTRITVDRRAIYRGITDQGVVYGGWLEGISSRNATTRFKGYHTFRLVKQSLERDKERIAQPLVTRFVREMNS